MNIAHKLLGLGLVLGLGTACNTGPYPDLGPEAPEPIVQPTLDGMWLGTDGSTVTVLVFAPRGDGTKFMRARVALDTSTQIELGEVDVDAALLGFAAETAFSRPYEPEVEYSARIGAREIDALPSWEVGYVLSEDTLVLLSEDAPLVRVERVFEAALVAADPATDVARLCNLLILIALARVPGYLGRDAADIYVTPRPFSGFVGGAVEIEALRFPRRLSSSFAGLTDTPELALAGSLVLGNAISGNGSLAGNVWLDFADDLADVSMDFSGVVVDDGYPAAGEVVVSIDGASSEVDFSVLVELGLTDLIESTSSQAS